jgi:hypothetical protein
MSNIDGMDNYRAHLDLLAAANQMLVEYYVSVERKSFFFKEALKQIESAVGYLGYNLVPISEQAPEPHEFETAGLRKGEDA